MPPVFFVCRVGDAGHGQKWPSGGVRFGSEPGASGRRGRDNRLQVR